MKNWDTFKCESCGWSGNTIDPLTGAKLGAIYNGQMLCSTCRVDKRLADGDFK